MRITVRIEDIEVTVDRHDFKEAEILVNESIIMKDVVLPSIKEATDKAKELYKLKYERP